MILCNVQNCINYRCKVKYSGSIKLAERSGRQAKAETADLRDENCGFKLDFLADDNINEFVKNKIED